MMHVETPAPAQQQPPVSAASNRVSEIEAKSIIIRHLESTIRRLQTTSQQLQKQCQYREQELFKVKLELTSLLDRNKLLEQFRSSHLSSNKMHNALLDSVTKDNHQLSAEVSKMKQEMQLLRERLRTVQPLFRLVRSTPQSQRHVSIQEVSAGRVAHIVSLVTKLTGIQTPEQRQDFKSIQQSNAPSLKLIRKTQDNRKSILPELAAYLSPTRLSKTVQKPPTVIIGRL